MEHRFNKEISPGELKERLSQNTILHIIDVREVLEYHTFNIGGENIPLGTLPQRLSELSYDTHEEIIVICQRGIRSETAQRLLVSAGFNKVRNLTGGLLAFRRIV